MQEYDRNLAEKAKDNLKIIWHYIKYKPRESIGTLLKHPDDKKSLLTESDKKK